MPASPPDQVAESICDIVWDFSFGSTDQRPVVKPGRVLQQQTPVEDRGLDPRTRRAGRDPKPRVW